MSAGAVFPKSHKGLPHGGSCCSICCSLELWDCNAVLHKCFRRPAIKYAALIRFLPCSRIKSFRQQAADLQGF